MPLDAEAAPNAGSYGITRSFGPGALPDDEMVAVFRRSAALGAVIVVVYGILALSAWFVGEPPDRSVSQTSAMTAICLILAGIAGYLQSRPALEAQHGWLIRAAAAAVLIIGCYAIATYVQGNVLAGYLLGPELGVMAPATALGFILLSLATLSGGLVQGHLRGGLATGGLMLAMIGIVSYAYDTEVIANVAPFAEMAPWTAASLALLYVATLLGQPDKGWIKYYVTSHSGSAVGRAILVAALVVPFILGWLMEAADRADLADAHFGFVVLTVETTFALGVVLSVALAWVLHSDSVLHQSEQALLESEYTLRQVIDSALDAFIQIDAGGRVTSWNPQAETIFGWTRSEAVGRELTDLIIPPAYRQAHDAGISRFLSTGERRIMGKRAEFVGRRKDGSEVEIELTVTAIPTAESFIFNGFLRDLTPQRDLEKRLKKGERIAALGNLAGGVAHDFNNTIAVIVACLDEIKATLPDNSEVEELADTALSAALSGAQVADRLLAFSRQQPLKPIAVDLNDLIANTGKLLKPTLSQDIELQLDLSPEIWAVVVDPPQLEAALLNLAANAQDAMPHGGQITIRTMNIRADDSFSVQAGDLVPGDYAVVEVTDNGEGMSAETRARLFEPFFTTKEPGKGTGLGLPMVYGFMKQSGGHISVYAELGIGTRFRLYLPRAWAEPGEQVEPPTHEMAERASSMETVLVVEDNANLRKLVGRQIESLGYGVREAANADDALAVFDENDIDLVFTDVIMPGSCDGVELARRLLAKSPNTRIVLASGFANSSVLQRMREFIPSIRILAKPCRKDELANALRAALEGPPHGNLIADFK